ncbi:MAG: hypothetical protein A2Y17_11335 [Clostridiales bacterium GWF2_38_85]|nr:MAG: hypothetical protein A2Y17_11335 [Clostridiales bacterium GWF2_38_85]HBL84717.1 hypothetical protein [Clostridiales bacterium]
MFYIKSKLLGGGTVKTEITDENVFTRCQKCECELPVDLVEILSDGESDLFSTSFICSRCTTKKVTDEVIVPIIYDGIVWLENILVRSGYGEEIQYLYDSFHINSLEDLRPEEYNEFGNALAKMAIGIDEG